MPGSSVARATGLLLAATLGAGCGAPVGVPADAVGTTSQVPTMTEVPTVADLDRPRPVADHTDPARRAGAAGRLIACDGPVHLGGWSPDFGGPGPAPDPTGALRAFLDQGLFGLPQDGYGQAAREPGRVLFTHEVHGAARVTVIVADAAVVDDELPTTAGWVVEAFATCDPAEYAPSVDDQLARTVWTDRDGDRVRTSRITSFPGPSHCDWQSVTFLSLGDDQYLRDPDGLLSDHTVMPYRADAVLPSDATDTGYRRDGDALWLSADRTIAYVVSAGVVEAWPATTQRVACM